MRVVIAQDGFLSTELTPAMPYDVSFVPCDNGAALAAALTSAEVLVTRRANVTDTLLQVSPQLRLIQQVGVGTDRIDLAAAARRGVVVANTPDAVSIAVAEHAILLILAALRGLVDQIDAVRAGHWSGQDVWEGRELAGSVLGIVGYGSIGRAISRRALAFDAKVLVNTRTAPQQSPLANLTFVDLHALLGASDVVVLAAALTPETRGLIGRNELARMKPTSFLINVARGAIVDETALVEAVESQALRGAALDAFVTEPLPLNSAFRRTPHIWATPHTAGSSQQSRHRIWQQIIDNLDCVAHGRPVKNLLA